MDDLTRWAHRTIKKGSKSFALASRAFDPETRRLAWLLYAWCRHCDDVVDGQDGGRGALDMDADAAARLEVLRSRTGAALSGAYEATDAFAALAAVAAATSMPRAHPFAHLDGFAMDVGGRAYRHIEDVLDYCYHVAGVVGVMMAQVMGIEPDDETVLLRAADLGIAFQLTNICRDIVEDAAIGRCYLPDEWLADAGIPPGEHARPDYRGALFHVAERMLNLADAYYVSAREGAAHLPFRSRWAVLTAAETYRAIGARVRAAGVHAWDERQFVPTLEKLRHVWQARADASAMNDAVPMLPRPALWKKGDTPDWASTLMPEPPSPPQA